MRSSVSAIKQTGIVLIEFLVTVITLLALNAVVIFPTARAIRELFS